MLMELMGYVPPPWGQSLKIDHFFHALGIAALRGRRRSRRGLLHFFFCFSGGLRGLGLWQRFSN